MVQAITYSYWIRYAISIEKPVFLYFMFASYVVYVNRWLKTQVRMHLIIDSMSKLNRYTKNSSVCWLWFVFGYYACRLAYENSPLTPTHLFVANLTLFSSVHRITKWAIECAYPFLTHQLKTNTKRIFAIRTFKPRLQYVAVRNENKTEHTNHTDTTERERDKQDCRDLMGVRQTSGPSACGRVELILNKLWMSI